MDATRAKARLLPAVALVLAVRNEEAMLEAAVRSALDQMVPDGGELEMCIAVAPSEDRTWNVAARLAAADDRVTVVENPAGLTPAGLNAAIRATSAPIVVRVDGHAELQPGYVARAMATLDRTGAVVVGGIQDAYGTTSFERAVALAMTSRFGAGDSRFHYGGPEGPVDTVYLGVFRRKELEAAGLYDEALVRNQDYELNYRLRRAGGEVWFDPALRVRYRPRGSLVGLATQFSQYGRWKRVVLWLQPRSVRWRHLVAPATVVLVAAGLALGAWWTTALILPVGYFAVVAVASVVNTRSPELVFRLLLVYPTMHLSWGLGFLSGAPTGVIRRLRQRKHSVANGRQVAS